MTVAPWIWLALCAAIVALLALDLVVLGRGSAPPTLRRSLGFSLAWTALGTAFAAVLGLWQGSQPAEEYLAGFLIEKSLSMDNCSSSRSSSRPWGSRSPCGAGCSSSGS